MDNLIRNLPRAGSRRRAIWDALTTKPQSAAQLARRVGITESNVRAVIESLRDKRLPVWNTWGQGFWTDSDFPRAPERSGYLGFSDRWQRVRR